MLEAQLISRDKGDMTEYEMYSVKLGRCDGYIMYAENSNSAAMELVCTSEEKANSLFSNICRCELSPVHLCDAVADMREYELML